MRIVGVFNLVMALVWVPVAIFAPHEGDGLVRHAQIFNAVIFSMFTAIWAAQEFGTYQAEEERSASGFLSRHRGSGPVGTIHGGDVVIGYERGPYPHRGR